MSVSIITVTQLKRNKTIELLANHINKQNYKNIIQWVIVEGSKTLEEANQNKLLIRGLKCNVPIDYIEFSGKPLGSLRNTGNRACTGDITVCMDDDDYYPPERVNHVVKKLLKSKFLLAGCSAKYLYDYDLKKMYKFKQFGEYHSTNDCMAWKKEYLMNHSHDENANLAEETSFTNNFTEPMAQLDPIKTIVSSSHGNNTFNKKEICVFTTIGIYPQAQQVEDKIIPKEIFKKYQDIFQRNETSQFDIIYFTGGTSIQWNPNDKKLGGSEQAVVHLSREWVSLGKKVAVYGNFKFENKSIDGVNYFNWKQFDYSAKYKTIIMWRMAGSNCLLPFDVSCDNLLMDFHDNFFQFRFNYEKEKHKIKKFLFKSNFHLESYQKVWGPLNQDQYQIIPNGLRIEEFERDHGVQRNPYRFCYCSCYTRGLRELLMYVWPVIYHNEPRAELHVYYGMEFVEDQHFIQEMDFLLSQPGVMDHGRTSSELIAREKQMSSFHLYITETPSEIDCISIRESLVCGCVPLISKFGVFAERDGLKFEMGLYESIAGGILKLLEKPEFINMARQEFKKSNTIVSWKDVAKHYEGIFKPYEEKTL
jgi:hypothetical protein